MNNISIPVIVIASVSGYIGFAHLTIYLRRRQTRGNLTFALMSLSVGLYAAFCAALYSATSTSEGAIWQRLQVSTLALIVAAFLWFTSDYTARVSKVWLYTITGFNLFAAFFQIVDPSDSTWIVNQQSIKEISLPLGIETTYYEVTPGWFTNIQTIVGLLSAVYILWIFIHFYRSGNQEKATPFIMAIGLFFIASINDSAVSIGLYNFIYTMEYAYLGMILLMTNTLILELVNAYSTREDLWKEHDLVARITTTSPVGIMVVERDGKITFANPQAAQDLGLTKEKITHLTYNAPEWHITSIDGNSLPDESLPFSLVMSTGKPVYNIQHAIKKPDGQSVMLSVNGAPLLDDNGHIDRVVLSFEDITDRVKAEEELLHLKEFNESIIQNMSEGIVIEDSQGYLSYANPAAESLLGYTNAEMTALHWTALIPPDQRSIVNAADERRMKGEADRYELELVRKDGKRIPVLVGGSPRFDRKSGQFVGTMAVFTDITMHKDTEDQLSFTQFAIDRVGNSAFWMESSGRLIYVNDATCRSLGYSRDELLSMRIHDIDPDYTKGNWPEKWENIKKLGSTSLESHHKGKNGKLIPVEVTANYMEYKGKEYNCAFASDISVRKNNEAELRQRTDELTTLNKIGHQVSAFLSLDQVIETSIHEVSKALQPDLVYLFLREETELRLKGADPQVQDLTSLNSPLFSLSKHLCETAFQRGKHIFSADIHRDPRFTLDEISQVEHKSFAIMPLLRGEESIGVLALVSQTRRHFNEQATYIETLVNEIATGLRNALLYEQAQKEITERKRAEELAQRQFQRLSALRNIDLAITSSLDLRVTLNVFLKQATDKLEVDAGAVLLLNSHNLTLEYAAGHGFRTSALQNTRLLLGEGHAGRAALERRMTSIPNLREQSTDFLRSPLFSSEGFRAYFGIPLITKGQVTGVLEIFHRRPLSPDYEWLEFLEALATQAAIAIDNTMLFNNLQRSNFELTLAYDTTLEGWAHALELRDMETEGHSQRVTEMTIKLARKMEVSEDQLVHVRRGALLHDIGKMAMPDSILYKPGPLSEEEWEVVRKHPVHAYQMLAPIEYLRPALDIPHSHHERWDGTGYPRGLQGEQIPLAARIFAVVDVWDAMTSDRPYRKAISQEETMAYIHAESGAHFDPQIVTAFEELITQTEV